MEFQRDHDLAGLISKERVLIIYGPRRVGKTTLLNDFLKQSNLQYKLAIGDNIRIQAMFNARDDKVLKEFAEGYELIAIDEAQYIQNVGFGLKIMVDQIPDLYVIATGSSSFDLEQQTGEPLTGRKKTIVLYPLSQAELHHHYNKHELKEQLEQFLIFGTYPEVLSASAFKEKRFMLGELAESYLLKDILALETIKASQQLWDLLKLLAFQIGHEISQNELATQIGLDVKTVGRYLDLLEKGFVIKSVRGFSRNLRNEITKKAKYYFIDTGVRNALVANFNSLKDRDDQGALFENFVVMERVKQNIRNNPFAKLYFWRTHQQQEIDLVEEYGGQLRGYEIKWSTKKRPKPPKAWLSAYEDASFQVINRDNYLEYLLDND